MNNSGSEVSFDESAVIRNEHGERIAFTFTPRALQRSAGASEAMVVIGHGVTSDRERPWSMALAAGLAATGIASLRIAFSGNGESEGRFADSCISKEVADLGSVLDALDGHSIAYVGHSMGGAVGAVRAARDPRIRALVSLAAIAHPREFVRRMFGHLRPGEPMLDKPHCPLSQTLVDDLEAIDSLTPRASEIGVPWRLVHGTADDVVPVQDSRDMVAAAGANAEPVELVELGGIDHSFSGDGLAALTAAVVPWIAGALSSRD